MNSLLRVPETELGAPDSSEAFAVHDSVMFQFSYCRAAWKICPTLLTPGREASL